MLASAEALLALQPHNSWPDRIELGVAAPYPPGSEAAYEVRSFFSGERGAVNPNSTGTVSMTAAAITGGTIYINGVSVAVATTLIDATARNP